MVLCRRQAHNMAATHGLAFPRRALARHSAAHCGQGRRVPGEDRRQARCSKLASIHVQASSKQWRERRAKHLSCAATPSRKQLHHTFRWSGDEMYADLNGWRLYLRDMKADGGKTMAQVREC
jgi:hypothetical protein